MVDHSVMIGALMRRPAAWRLIGSSRSKTARQNVTNPMEANAAGVDHRLACPCLIDRRGPNTDVITENPNAILRSPRRMGAGASWSRFVKPITVNCIDLTDPKKIVFPYVRMTLGLLVRLKLSAPDHRIGEPFSLYRSILTRSSIAWKSTSRCSSREEHFGFKLRKS